MSASYGLVKFKRTRNIYMCCYEGTSDILNPYICTSEECYYPKIDCYCAIYHCRKLAKGQSYVFPDNVDDLDEVEIYSDYGGGFYWSGTGSESIKMVKGPLDPLGINDYYGDEGLVDITTDGIPEWVEEWERSVGVYDEQRLLQRRWS